MNPTQAGTERVKTPAGHGPGTQVLLGAVLACVAVAGALSVSAPLGGGAEPGFLLERAQRDVARLARAPHPVGSAEHAEVAAYCASELAAAGFETRVERRVSVRSLPGLRVRAASTANVLGRLRGTGNGDAILLVSHYDSVPHAPGAGDDGAGVAALLETARALHAGPRLRNDVIVLFSDAEELGLLGARAFAEHDPWAQDVRLVLNFEGRGTRGPSILFETAGASPQLMREVARSPGVLAYSFSEDVYRVLPNDTDFTVLRPLGVPGFNFAFIHGSGAYHSPLDTPARLDPRSLADHGRHALGLTRAFGGADLRALPEPAGSVYFTLPPFGLIVYPQAWTLALAVVLLLGGAFVLGRAVASRRVGVGGLIMGALDTLVIVVVTAVLAFIVQVLALAASGAGRRAFGDGGLFVTGIFVLSVGLAALGLTRLVRKRGPLPAATGVAVVWLVLALLASFGSPASSYMWTLPLLFALPGLWALLRDAPRAQVIGALCTLPALALWAPALALVGVALGVGTALLLAPLAALPALLVLALVVPLFGPGGTRRAAWALTLAGVVLVGVSAVRAARGVEQPRRASVFFAFDADGGTGAWATTDERPDAWTAQFVGQAPQRRTLEGYSEFGAQRVLATDAPGVSVPAAGVALTDEQPSAEGHGRRLRLHVTPCCESSGVTLLLSPGTAIGELSVAGSPVDLGRYKGAVATGTLDFSGVPGAGFDVELGLSTDQRLEVVAISRTDGLPAVAGATHRPRPEGLVAGGLLSDVTLAKRKFVF